MTLLSVRLRSDEDLVAARQHAREIARLLGFPHLDQIRLATAVSEVVRNAIRYADGGDVTFAVGDVDGRPSLLIRVIDHGPGISNLDQVLAGAYESKTGMGLGIVGARRLMGSFAITTSPEGTSITMREPLPTDAIGDPGSLREHAATLASRPVRNSMEELLVQNGELAVALDRLNERRQEIERLNRELEDTNRGVLALYAEVDEKAESLREASVVKSRFLSNMSHEFRTPLNSIISLAGLLEMGADGTLGEEQLRQVGFIRAAAKSLSEMVDDLLDIAKIESGRVSVEISEVDLGRLFAALRGMFKPLFDHDKVALRISDPDPPIVMATDEGKLGQILRNLLSNAMKFTERGSVTLEARRSEGEVEIRVTDTGIGIPEANLSAIFEEFTQVSNPLQKSRKGTGLGLPLSRKLATLLGGTLGVDSRVGQGSVFSVQLPLMHPRGSRPATGEPAASDRATRRVLVVDDEESWRYIFRSLLPPGWHVEEAESGAEAMQKGEARKPDAIVLDLVLPGQTGIEILDRLSQHPTLAEVPVWIYSSKVLTGEERALLSRARGIISKNHSTTEEGRRAIRRALEGAHPSGRD